MRDFLIDFAARWLNVGSDNIEVTLAKSRLKLLLQKEAYHHGDLRRALIGSARKIVSAKGSGEVSLRAVARLAGVSHNAPYRHFASREDLLAAVAAGGFRELAAQLKAAVVNASADEKLKALGKAYLRFALANRGLYLLMFGADLDKSGADELGEASRDALAQLEAGLAARGGRGLSAAKIAAWAFVHGLVHLIIDRQIDLAEEEIPAVFAAVGKVFGPREARGT